MRAVSPRGITFVETAVEFISEDIPQAGTKTDPGYLRLGSIEQCCNVLIRVVR